MGFGDLLGTGNLGCKRYEMAGGLRAQQFKNKFLGTRLCPSLSARNSIALHALDFVADHWGKLHCQRKAHFLSSIAELTSMQVGKAPQESQSALFAWAAEVSSGTRKALMRLSLLRSSLMGRLAKAGREPRQGLRFANLMATSLGQFSLGSDSARRLLAPECILVS